MRVKRLVVIFGAVFFVFMTACGMDSKHRGVLYKKEDIFLECIKCDYPEQFTSKILIIESEEQLNYAMDTPVPPFHIQHPALQRPVGAVRHTGIRLFRRIQRPAHR